jgi:hypothetical protein
MQISRHLGLGKSLASLAMGSSDVSFSYVLAFTSISFSDRRGLTPGQGRQVKEAVMRYTSSRLDQATMVVDHPPPPLNHEGLERDIWSLLFYGFPRISRRDKSGMAVFRLPSCV